MITFQKIIINVLINKYTKICHIKTKNSQIKWKFSIINGSKDINYINFNLLYIVKETLL
jgi:hypothetical protein